MLWVFLLNVFLLPALVVRYSHEVEREDLFVVLRNFSILMMAGSSLAWFMLVVVMGDVYGMSGFMIFPLIVQFSSLGPDIRLSFLGIPLVHTVDLEVILLTIAPMLMGACALGWLIGYYRSRLIIEKKKAS